MSDRKLVLWQSEWFANDRFFDLSAANQADLYPSPDHSAIFDNADSLEVLLEFPLANTSSFAAVTAQILGFSTLGHPISVARLWVPVEGYLFCPLGAFVLFESAHCFDFVINSFKNPSRAEYFKPILNAIRPGDPQGTAMSLGWKRSENQKSAAGIVSYGTMRAFQPAIPAELVF